MFHLLRLIIWMVGLVVVATFVFNYFGYEINWHYFDERKSACQEQLNECQKQLIRQGLESFEKCDFQCVDPKLILQKK